MGDDLKATTQQLSIDDYRFDKPALENAMQGLTLGEEHGYYTKACRTMGAIYETAVSANSLSIKVMLPDSLALNGMTEKEARGHENYLHNQMEEAIVWIIRWHQIQRGLNK